MSGKTTVGRTRYRLRCRNFGAAELAKKWCNRRNLISTQSLNDLDVWMDDDEVEEFSGDLCSRYGSHSDDWVSTPWRKVPA